MKIKFSRKDRELLNRLTLTLSNLSIGVSQMALNTEQLNTAFQRLSSELGETAEAIAGLKDKISADDAAAQAVVDDAVAKLNAASDTLDGLQQA